MIEIIVLFLVAGWFHRTASNKGRSGLLWALIGIGSYLVPLVLVGRVVLPLVFVSLPRGWITYQNQGMYSLIGLVFTIAAGITGCLFARKTLISMAERDDHAVQERETYP